MNIIQRLFWAIVALAALGLIAYGISRGTTLSIENTQGVTQEDKVAENPCTVDISAIILEDLEGNLKTKEEVAQAVFNNYFDKYTDIPDCGVAGIKSYRLASVSNIQETDETHFTADIVFDLEPVSIAETEWDTPEVTVDGGWIKNKQGMLSIRKYEGRYYLVF